MQSVTRCMLHQSNGNPTPVPSYKSLWKFLNKSSAKYFISFYFHFHKIDEKDRKCATHQEFRMRGCYAKSGTKSETNLCISHLAWQS